MSVIALLMPDTCILTHPGHNTTLGEELCLRGIYQIEFLTGIQLGEIVVIEFSPWGRQHLMFTWAALVWRMMCFC